MQPNEHKLTPSEKLNAENEIEQAKLEMEGAIFYSSSDAPPEIISQFLKNIKTFNAGLETPPISVNEHLGRPKLPTDLPHDSDEIPVLIESINALCADKGLNIIRPIHLTDSAYYRFIINDVLPHRIQPPVEGMTLIIDYDDFYEDSLFFLEKTTQDIVESIIDLSLPFDKDLLSENCRKVHGAITKMVALQSIEKFRSKYSQIIPIAFSLMEKEFTPSALYQLFGIEWEGVLRSNGQKEKHEGLGICQLNLYDRKWLVEGVTFPGFDF